MGFMDELRKLTQPYEDEDDFYEGADPSAEPAAPTEAQLEFENAFGGRETPERAEEESRIWILPAKMAAGTAVLYTIGTAWFMIQSGNALGTALSLCVVPFLPGDAVKIAAAVMLTVPVRKAVYSIHNS